MQNTDMLNTPITSFLNEGEVILWAGRPSKIRLLDAPYGTPVVIRWTICLIIAALAVLYRIVYTPTAGSTSVNGNVVMLVVIVVAALIALFPVKNILKLNKNCYYYITDRRALSLVTGSSIVLKEKWYTDVQEITYDILAADRGNIYVGNKQKNSKSKARTSILTRQVESEDEAKLPLTLYNVSNIIEVISFFPELKSDVR